MLKFFKKRSNSLKEKPPENYDITQYYDIGKEIGKGAFSIVKEATHKQSGKKYAIKTVNKKFINEKDLKLLGREIDIMKKLEHPNIVNLFEVVEFEDELHIIMELVSGGELFDHIVERGSYSEKDASQIVKQLCEAVSFMHKNGVAHRDLKVS
jgi:calcium/calmodulin-dependent protein kinase I